MPVTNEAAVNCMFAPRTEDWNDVRAVVNNGRPRPSVDGSLGKRTVNGGVVDGVGGGAKKPELGPEAKLELDPIFIGVNWEWTEIGSPIWNLSRSVSRAFNLVILASGSIA